MMAFTKLTTALHLPRLTGGNQRYTDTNEFLSPGVLIAFHARAVGVVYPPLAQKTAVNRAAIQARNAVRIANDELAKVVILRRDESAVFTATMERHFHLSSTGGLAGGWLTDNTINKPFKFGDVFKHDRRWALEQIRQKMLSLSFHLNTGIYLIDMDEAQRTSIGGNTIVAGSVLAAGDEAYTYAHALNSRFPLCGFRNGEIHVDFGVMTNFSLNSGARIIIHEAAHKFLNPQPDTYAWDVNYPPTLDACLEGNPDSFAWTALSLATGVLRMPNAGSNNWDQCPGGAL
jgi:hypothetical protein